MSKDLWYTSDHHFGHASFMTKFKKEDGVTPARPFSSVEHMDEVMIERWNAVVKPGDVVHHLGDIGFSQEHLQGILPRLNGKIYLVLGNHDRLDAGWYDKHFDKVRGEFHFGSRKEGVAMICTHIPIHESSFRYGTKCINVHGHLHDRVIPDPRYVNICVEQTDYTPVHYDWLMAKARKL